MSFYSEDKPHQSKSFETGVDPSSPILESSSEYRKHFPGQIPPESLKEVSSDFVNFSWYWRKILMWFGNLPIRTKFAVGGLGLIFGYAIAQAMLKLVASIISVALLLVLLYLGYKIWVSGSEEN